MIKTSCKLSELYRLSSDIEKIIKHFENGLVDVTQIQIGGIQIVLNICNDNAFTSKSDLSNNFMSNKSLNSSTNSYIKQLENEIEELRYNIFHQSSLQELENAMLNSYSECFPITYQPISLIASKDIHTQISIEIEHMSMKQLNHLKEKTIKDLEWECIQAQTYRQKYEKNLQELADKEKSIKIYINNIQLELANKVKYFEREKIKIKEEENKIIIRENKINEHLKNVKEEIHILKEKLTCEDVLVNKTNTFYISPRTVENKETNPLEKKETSPLEKIEEEIKIAELELENSSDKNALNFKINRLKNKLSVARTEQILNAPTITKRSNSFQNQNFPQTTPRVSNPKKLEINFDFQKNSVPSTPRVGSRNFTCLSTLSSGFSSRQSPQLTSRINYPNTNIENMDTDENFEKLLELKDTRLRKKEEELYKKEIQLQNT